MTNIAAWPTATAHHNGPVGLTLTHAGLQIKGLLRTPEFLAGIMLTPLLLYVMFGLSTHNTLGRTWFMVSLAAHGVITIAIFVLGDAVAQERGRGWRRTLQATGFPPAVHLVAKTVAGLGQALLVVTALVLLAWSAGGVEVSPARWLLLGATLMAGFLAFAPLGLAIAYLARPRTATVIANVVFLPLSFASGFFFPLSQLPDVVAHVAPFLPTTHFGQLAYRAVMLPEDVSVITGVQTQPLWMHAAWVIGATVLLAALALWGAHREAVTRRG